MANQIIGNPSRVLDMNGYVVPGAKMTVYQAGTATLLNVYSDLDGTILAANPVIADANGIFPQRYFNADAAKVVITDADDVPLYTLDPAPATSATGSAASQISFAPSEAVPATNVQDAIDTVATQIGFGAGPLFDNVAAVISDTVLTYTPSVNLTVESGDIVQTRSEGFAFEVAASGATDQHLTTAGGVKLYALPDASGSVSVKQFGAVGNGTADDTAAFVAWVKRLYTAKVKGYIPAGTYSITYLRDRTVTGAVVIKASPQAVVKGIATNDSVAGTGANTSATATFAAGFNGYRVIYVTGGVETIWTAGVEYTATGTLVNWAAGSAPHGALAIGDTVRIISADPVIEIGSSTVFSHHFEWRGGVIDNSLRGYALSVASGSGLTINDFKGYQVEGVTFQGATDHEVALANGVCDSGFTPVRCNGGEVHNCQFVGQSDLGIYITGGALAAATDDGAQHSVHSNYFYGCNGGVSAKRDANGVIIQGNTFDRCNLGATLFHVGDGIDAGKGVIANNRFIRCGRRPIDVRRTTGFAVTGNVITDYGYEIDGTTPATGGTAGINVSGADNGVISGNVIEFLDLAAPSGGWGIQLGEDSSIAPTRQTNRVMVTGNNLSDVHSGIRELNTGQYNVWDGNQIVGATSPVSMIATRIWNYRTGDITTEGHGATFYEDAFTPTFEFRNAAGSPSFSYARQSARYVRRGNLVTVFVSIQATVTHLETAKDFVVNTMPFTTRNITNIVPSGTVNFCSGIAFPGSSTQIVCETPFNTTYVRFRGVGTAGAGGIITSDNITTGASVRLDFSITYEAEPHGAT